MRAAAQAAQLAAQIEDAHKKVAVSLCHAQLHDRNADFPEGCRERLQQRQTGAERWQGLADALGLDVLHFDGAAELLALENALQRVHASLQGAPQDEALQDRHKHSGDSDVQGALEEDAGK